MTTDTIKDVLGRIISINKNLTESSLRNLLVASGWENADIEEGAKVFNDYMGKTNTPPSQEEVKVADLKIPIPERDPVETAHVSASGLSSSAVERSINDTIEVKQTVVHEEPVVVTPTPAPVVVEQAVSHGDIPMVSDATRPWALIIIDSVLFLIALGLLIYIITN